MKKVLMAMGMLAFVTSASAQTKKPAKKAAVKKECTMAEGDNCCESMSKAKGVSTVKKPALKKG